MEGDVIASLGEPRSDRETDAARAPGDEGRAPARRERI
jgi:hypothetical protein